MEKIIGLNFLHGEICAALTVISVSIRKVLCPVTQPHPRCRWGVRGEVRFLSPVEMVQNNNNSENRDTQLQRSLTVLTLTCAPTSPGVPCSPGIP